MKDAEVIHVLHVTLLEVQSCAVLFRQEVKRVQGFGLGFGDWRDIGRSRLSKESSEVASCILDQDPLWGFCGC